MKIDLAQRSTSHHHNGDVTYWLTVDRVSLLSHLKWKAYHWYDMRIPNRIPGWRGFENFLRDRFGAEILLGFEGERDPRWCDRILSWQYGQDLRCHHLNKHDLICRIEIDRETYEAFKRP